MESAGLNKHDLVLVIDDEASSQALARLALEQLGFNNIAVVDDGAAALELLDRPQPAPALIICDIFMPQADGIELVNALAERHFQGALVLVTGGDSQFLVIAKRVARFRGLRLLGSLHKPLSSTVLEQVLQGGSAPAA